jgi:hypothetical protein
VLGPLIGEQDTQRGGDGCAETTWTPLKNKSHSVQKSAFALSRGLAVAAEAAGLQPRLSPEYSNGSTRMREQGRGSGDSRSAIAKCSMGNPADPRHLGYCALLVEDDDQTRCRRDCKDPARAQRPYGAGRRQSLSARAYARAADNLALSPLPFEQQIAQDRLKEIPGIGDALEAVIAKIYETG